MSGGEVNLGMSIPLDSDGFLRRQCPVCEREFKWLFTSDDAGTSAVMAAGGYFCPYCGIQASPDQWFTRDQLELAENIFITEVVGPMLKQGPDEMGTISPGSDGLMSAGAHTAPAKRDPLTEVDDMTRVDFGCHPSEPVKLIDTWSKPARCLICGQPKG